MSNSYYCCVCGQEMLEIKNADSLIKNIADILILCEECGKNNKLCISAEKNIGKCKWKFVKEYNKDEFSGGMPLIVKLYETKCEPYCYEEIPGKYCPHCGKEIEEI